MTASVSNESRNASSAAPKSVWTSPSGVINAIAGCDATLNRANTSAESSLICGNDNEYLSRNSTNSSSDPLHATPTNSTCPAHFWLASSTEGASRLQVIHQGAQNHNSTGRLARVAISMSPPPNNGAVNLNASGTLAGISLGAPGSVAVGVVATAGVVTGALVCAAEVTGAAVGSVVVPPHAARRPTKAMGRRRRNIPANLEREPPDRRAPRLSFANVSACDHRREVTIAR